ncbi:hypothetical protein KIMC2_00880 [Xylocopilactobacillus apis]|uniref:Peptidase M56 domain-containing protein n=1 Tax=Xylocopilactobacillus apis TaxID=2932183 RepID=A0AAU9CZ75_9LACO|nr:hypothetical protein KIMC2_00880 [Xylocopilactobacillus apis]
MKDLPPGYLAPNVQKMIPSKIKVKSISSKESPFAWGIVRPMIAMPLYQFDEVDQKNIIMHELAHISSYDALKKFFLEVLVCLYWWFPLIYVFKDQVTLILEMNVDCRIVKDLSKKSYFDYIRSLINIAEFSSCSKTKVKQRAYFSNFVIDEGSTLKKRESFLLEEYSIKRTKWPLVVILVVMPLLLTSIIIEPYTVNNNKVQNAFKIDPNDTDTYILKKENRYELIVKGKKVGSVRNLNKIKSPIIKQLPVKRIRNYNE